MAEFVRRHSPPGILDDDRHPCRLLIGREGNLPPWWRILDRIVQQIRDDLPQSCGVGRHPYSRRGGGRDAQLVFVDHILIKVHHLRQQ